MLFALIPVLGSLVIAAPVVVFVRNRPIFRVAFGETDEIRSERVKSPSTR